MAETDLKNYGQVRLGTCTVEPGDKARARAILYSSSDIRLRRRRAVAIDCQLSSFADSYTETVFQQLREKLLAAERTMMAD